MIDEVVGSEERTTSVAKLPIGSERGKSLRRGWRMSLVRVEMDWGGREEMVVARGVMICSKLVRSV